MVAFRRRRWLDQLVVRGGRGERDAEGRGRHRRGGQGGSLKGRERAGWLLAGDSSKRDRDARGRDHLLSGRRVLASGVLLLLPA